MKITNQLHLSFYVPLLASIILIIIVALCNLKIGAINYSWHDVLSAILHPESTSIATITIIQIRLPMVFIAIMGGAGLAVSGLLLQSVTQNPLACPSLSGIEYATAFSVILCYMLNPGMSRPLIVIIALSGGILTYLLMQMISKNTGASSTGITLIGVAFNSLYYSAMQAIMIAFPYQSQAILYDLNGSLYGITLADIKFIILPFIGLILGAFLLSKRLDLLTMDEHQAAALGLAIKKYRNAMLGIAILLTTLITSTIGPLLFFGLVIPHLVRPFVRGSHVALFSAALGALFLLIAEFLTQIIAPQTPPPIGLVMLLMIAPLLIFIIQRYLPYDEH